MRSARVRARAEARGADAVSPSGAGGHRGRGPATGRPPLAGRPTPGTPTAPSAATRALAAALDRALGPDRRRLRRRCGMNLAQTPSSSRRSAPSPRASAKALRAKAESLSSPSLPSSDCVSWSGRRPGAGYVPPRRRRGGRVPEADRRGAPRAGGDQAVLAAPRRRLHRPQRPDPRPSRQPALAPTSTATPRRATNGSARSTSFPRRGRRGEAFCAAAGEPPRLPAYPARAAPPPPSRSPSTWPPSSPTSAPPASRSPPPATAHRPPGPPPGLPGPGDALRDVRQSAIDDQGRAKRLFQDALRLALNLLYPEYTAVGCSIPATGAKHTTRRPGPRRQDPPPRRHRCPFHHHEPTTPPGTPPTTPTARAVLQSTSIAAVSWGFTLRPSAQSVGTGPRRAWMGTLARGGVDVGSSDVRLGCANHEIPRPSTAWSPRRTQAKETFPLQLTVVRAG